MIILGASEPSLADKREIRRATCPVDKLIDAESVVLSVPSASVLVAVNNSAGRVRELTIYYECSPDTPTIHVTLRGVLPGDPIPEGFRLLGHIWVASSLVALYAENSAA